MWRNNTVKAIFENPKANENTLFRKYVIIESPRLYISMSGVVLGGVVMVVGSSLARGKIFTAWFIKSLCIYLLYESASVSDPV